MVWIDQESLPDGSYSAGDSLVDGLTIFLYEVVDGEISATPLMTTTTSNGAYQFTGLKGGEYQVVIPVSEFAPGGVLYNEEKSRPYDVSPYADTDSADDDSNHNAFTDDLGVVSNVITLGDSDGEPTGENAHGLTAVEGDVETDWTVDFAFYLVDPTAISLSSPTVNSNNSMLIMLAIFGSAIGLTAYIHRKSQA